MNCMKCGRETADGQVFCPDCLAEMEKYPVKPGTSVQLPVQPPDVDVSKPRHPKKRTAEDQMNRLRRVLWAVTGVAVALLIALTISVNLLLQAQEQQYQLPLGQNYSTNQSTDDQNTD